MNKFLNTVFIIVPSTIIAAIAIIVIQIILSSLWGQQDPTALNTTVVLKDEQVRMEFVEITSRPKHFYCTVRDLDYNVTLYNTYISKHFNAWQQLRPGMQFKAYRTVEQIERGWLCKYYNLDKCWVLRPLTRYSYEDTKKPPTTSYYGLYNGLKTCIE